MAVAGLGNIRDEECEKGIMILTCNFSYHHSGLSCSQREGVIATIPRPTAIEEATQDQLFMSAVDNSVIFIS